MTKEEFYNKFLKIVRPEHNVFKKLTKELMTENCLLDEFTECVEKGIFTLIKETDQYFINWNLLKSYIKDQSSNYVESENKELNNKTKLIAELVKEVADLRKQVRKSQNELNTKNEVDKTEKTMFYEKNENSYILNMPIK